MNEDVMDMIECIVDNLEQESYDNAAALIEAVYEEIDNSLIYDSDLWTIIRYYGNPYDIISGSTNYYGQHIIDKYYDDVFAAVEKSEKLKEVLDKE